MKLLQKPFEKCCFAILPLLFYFETDYFYSVLALVLFSHWLLQVYLIVWSARLGFEWLETAWFLFVGLLLSGTVFLHFSPYWILSVYFLTSFPKKKDRASLRDLFQRGYRNVLYPGIMFLVTAFALKGAQGLFLLWPNVTKEVLFLGTLFLLCVIAFLGGRIFKRRLR